MDDEEAPSLVEDLQNIERDNEDGPAIKVPITIVSGRSLPL